MNPTSVMSTRIMTMHSLCTVFYFQDDVADVPLAIAITGTSGSGKSTLVNTMRGLGPRDYGAAAVGVIETTHKPQEYPHPEHEHFVLWDLPGVGTKYFPRHSYFSDVKAASYDFFLIATTGRFTENDIWLAKELQELAKPYYFVRTKVNIDISNDIESTGNNGNNDKNVISKIKKEYSNTMIINNIRAKLFVISGKKQHDTIWEYPDLIMSITRNLPKLKQHQFVLAAAATSKEMIEEKCERLEWRIVNIAMVSAAAAAIPFPGVSIVADVALLVEEIYHYKNQMELDDESLSKVARTLDVPKS